jgi:alkanesulfonate monooxygenase SsuD/methylene tetrahydromethanopterin reductase-like flavin-dependent oxidoreductase (luciferase family)
MPEFGVVTTVASTKQAVVFAEAAEALGFSRVGMADTAPKLFHATYPAVTAALMRTSKLSVGPYVTNPVTRHWSVHAATARALEELAPGRFYIGLATGDGAVHSVGLKPAKLVDFENYIREMRTIWPEQSKIHMAFSGPKGVELAGRVADELTIAVGLDEGTIRNLADRANAARAAVGIKTPLRIWINPLTYIVGTEAEVEPMRKSLRNIAYSGARFSLDFSMEDKNIPEHMKPILKERLAKYDFAYKGKVGDNPNAHLFDDYPEIENYLVDRMVLTGTAEQCAEKLGKLIKSLELSGIWFPTIPRTANLGDHLSDLAALERAFRPLIAG